MINPPITPQSKQAQQAARKTAIAGVLTNLAMTFIKAGGGWVSGSQALIADAIHSLADLITDIISFVAVQLGRGEADSSHPYGHGKFETFGTLILAVFLLGTAAGMSWHLLQDVMADGGSPRLGLAALIAAGLSILLNEGLFRYCLREGNKVDAKPIIANAWHHRADGLSSVAVFAGITLQLAGFAYGDTVAAAFVVLFLLKTSYTLGREAFDDLVDAAIPQAEQTNMAKTITATEGVEACHLLRGRRLGSDTIVDVHLGVNPLVSVSEGHRIAEMVEKNIKEAHPKVTDVTVHIEPVYHEHHPESLDDSPSRHKLEALARDITARTCHDVEVSDITLHFVDNKIQVDIVFTRFPLENDTREQNKKALEAALLAQTPFTQVRLLMAL